MRFFVDNNLSPALVKGMKGFGEDVVHLKDHFEANADDAKWLTSIGSKGWFLITRDDRIRYRPNEVEALKENKVGAFFLGGKHRTRCELIQQVVRNWPQIKESAAKTRRPFAIRVPIKGKLKPLRLS